jgi:hypothetical protein
MLSSLPRLFPIKKENDEDTNVEKIRKDASFPFHRFMSTTGMSEYSQDQVSLKNAIQLISVLPVPICIISTNGTILSTNSEFRTQIDVPVVRSSAQPNMLELISPKDQDKFFSKLKEVQECLDDTTMISVGTCGTKVLLANGVSNYEPYDWTLSTVGRSRAQPFILLTGSAIKEAERGHSTSSSSSMQLDDSTKDTHPIVSSWNDFQNKVKAKSKLVIAHIEAKILSDAAVEISSNQRGFIRQLSHEIRTPLNIISASLSYLETFKEHVDSSVLDIIADIESASSQSVTVLDNFLVYERLESNSLVMNRHSANVLTLVDEAMKLFKAQVSSIGFLLGTSNLWHRR